MIKVQELLNSIVFIKKRWIFILDLFSVVLLTYIFTQNFNDTAPAYIIYLVSGYSLIITIVHLYGLTTNLRGLVLSNHHINHYYSNIHYRMKMKLHTSVTINIIYALLKLIVGCYYQSIWEIHIGTYYLIICIVRIILLKQMNYGSLGKDKILEYKKYKLCSYFILALNIILTGVVILMVLQNYTYQYPGYIIYIAAMYTFYITISSIINVIKYRTYKSPLINATNIICFITALVSVLSLQTAMLTQFATEGIAAKQLANGLTGVAICTIIFIVSIYMIVHAKKELNKLKSVT